MINVKFPDVEVTLVGEDGNAFSIIARVSKALERAGYRDEAKEFTTAAMNSESYDALLQLCVQWVTCN